MKPCVFESKSCLTESKESSKRMRKSSSYTQFGNGMKRSPSTESVRAKENKYVSVMKKCKSADEINTIKHNLTDVVKQNVPGVLYDLVKDGTERLQSVDTSHLSAGDVVHTLQSDIGSIMVNHVTQSSIMSVVSHVAKHPPF